MANLFRGAILSVNTFTCAAGVVALIDQICASYARAMSCISFNFTLPAFSRNLRRNCVSRHFSINLSLIPSSTSVSYMTAIFIVVVIQIGQLIRKLAAQASETNVIRIGCLPVGQNVRQEPLCFLPATDLHPPPLNCKTPSSATNL